MRTPGKPRKPQINVEVTLEEKQLFEEVANARGVKTATLLKMLAHDEARRLGIK
jgi:hypothetical protein